jgi:elongation factor G
LIENKAIIGTITLLMGSTFELLDIPANMKEEAEEWRGKLIESVAEAR